MRTRTVHATLLGFTLALGACGSPSAPTAPADDRAAARFQGKLVHQEEHFFRFRLESPGAFEARAAWSGAPDGVRILVQDTAPPFDTLARSSRTGAQSVALALNVAPGEVLVILGNFSGAPVEYDLEIAHPRGELVRSST